MSSDSLPGFQTVSMEDVLGVPAPIMVINLIPCVLLLTTYSLYKVDDISTKWKSSPTSAMVLPQPELLTTSVVNSSVENVRAQPNIHNPKAAVCPG